MKPTTTILPSRRSRWQAFATIAFVAAAVVLASCTLSRPAPVKRMFLLEPAMPAPVATAKPISVRVGVVNVAAPFRGKTFVYREGELRYDSDYYDEFFVAPAIMLSETTAKALASANVFRRVVPFGAAADDGEFVLDGFVSELYGDARNPAAQIAVVTMAFYLSPTNVAGPTVIWSREYRQRVAVTGTSPGAMAAGWNTALTNVFADLARDLAAAELPAK
jgi:cholesterol transport system auxiliary component